MLTSKERAQLRAIAQNVDPIFQIGKNGVSQTFVEQLSNALECREIIKINVLKSCDFSSKELIDELANKLNAEPVQAIGNKITLYRKSGKKDVQHIL